MCMQAVLILEMPEEAGARHALDVPPIEFPALMQP